MRSFNLYTGGLAILLFAGYASTSCTKQLKKNVYSQVPETDFWQTPEQIAAGVAPAYQALTQIPDDAVHYINEISGGEIIAPTRGEDWNDNGEWRELWEHTWRPGLGVINDAWSEIYDGIGKTNFILGVVNSLTTKPADLDNINAELSVLRDYYYYLVMDMWGNVPLVTDYNTDPNTVTNSSRLDVFNYLEKDLLKNVPLLQGKSDTTYGRLTKWAGYTLLAKLYLNAEVYTGTQRYADCIKACDNIISANAYSLGDYFDNFSINNEGSFENIFVVPFDKVNIPGNYWEMETLHYQLNTKYGLIGSPWNGFCSTSAYYDQFDSADGRKKMFLVGQQYDNAGNPIIDVQTGLPVNISPYVNQFSSGADSFRMAGVRNIKYTPEAGTGDDDGNIGQSNDMVLFRYADVLLMKAEAEIRSGTNPGDALTLVNRVRARAYGNSDHDWNMADLTLPNLFAERQREFAWEGNGRQDAIRFGTFGDARKPGKQADRNKHYEIFPIPSPQISSNPKLVQNPGY